MDSSSLLSLFLVFSFLHLGLSEAADGPSLSCVQKFLPCKDSFKSLSQPAEECCMPLEEVIDTDAKCLCDFFSDPKTLQSMNVTREQALKLPEACNLQADITSCKDAGEPIPLTGAGSTPSEGLEEATPSTGSSVAASPMSAAAGSGAPSSSMTDANAPSPSSAFKITHLGAVSFIALAFAAY